jgi:hypothetical protein
MTEEDRNKEAKDLICSSLQQQYNLSPIARAPVWMSYSPALNILE